MEEFIERGDNKMFSCYISSVEKFISTYDLDINESTARESLPALIENLFPNNHHVCVTILKYNFSL